MLKKAVLSFFVLLLLSSCASRKKLAYYQNIDSFERSSKSTNFETRLQPDDLLSIVVMGENPEIVAPFNSPLSSTSTNSVSNSNGSSQSTSYLMDSNGSIQFPVLGLITFKGLTKTEAENMLLEKLSKYVKNPKVILRIMNFKISVQGEVANPGSFSIATERVTLIEALSLAGDLTIFGKRNNLLLLREQNGLMQAVRVDITQADFINSPYYYLAQNDVLYVEPNKTKMSGSAVSPNIGIAFSAISLLITIVVLTTQ